MEKPETVYVALLRGINVGGKNVIKMVDLKVCFEEIGFTDVLTYIQSGNVIFSTDESDTERLMNTIERSLSTTFGKNILTVIVSQKELQETVKHAPVGYGTEPEKYRYDIYFLKPSVDSREAVKRMSVKEGVDEIWAGKNVIYTARLIEMATKSRLSKIISLPFYKDLTIRNWNTTTKLLSLMEK